MTPLVGCPMTIEQAVQEIQDILDNLRSDFRIIGGDKRIELLYERLEVELELFADNLEGGLF